MRNWGFKFKKSVSFYILPVQKKLKKHDEIEKLTFFIFTYFSYYDNIYFERTLLHLLAYILENPQNLTCLSVIKNTIQEEEKIWWYFLEVDHKICSLRLFRL